MRGAELEAEAPLATRASSKWCWVENEGGGGGLLPAEEAAEALEAREAPPAEREDAAEMWLPTDLEETTDALLLADLVEAAEKGRFPEPSASSRTLRASATCAFPGASKALLSTCNAFDAAGTPPVLGGRKLPLDEELEEAALGAGAGALEAATASPSIADVSEPAEMRWEILLVSDALLLWNSPTE